MTQAPQRPGDSFTDLIRPSKNKVGNQDNTK